MKRSTIVSIVILPILILTLPVVAKADDILAEWKFDNIEHILGNAWLVEGVEGKAAQFDGFTAHVRLEGSEVPEFDGDFFVEAWIAIGAYPWNWCPVVEQRDADRAGFSFGIDDQGRAGLYISAGDEWRGVRSEQRIALRTWAHVVAVHESGKGIRLFIDGEPAGRMEIQEEFTPAPGATVWMGKNPRKLPQTHGIRGEDSHMKSDILFDGILDEVRISQGAKSEYAGPRPEAPPPLPMRTLPAGPEGPGPFGAFYTRLEYYKGWDDLWRVAKDPDVVVRFDEGPFRFVFWRGTTYIPNWVTGNGIWYNNEFNETWGPHGCHEPMSDKRCQFAHVRIIESTDARVVVHWRYALVDVLYGFARVDPVTGWGDWTDEVYTLYPDGTGVRKITLHSDDPASPHEWHEGMIVMGPGMRPEDALEPAGLTLVDIDGNHATYSWKEQTPPARPKKPEKACIQLINTRSRYRPFAAARPVDAPWFDVYSGETRPEVSMYPWWNHWPTAFQPSDGRYAQAADRASHSSLTHLHWKEHDRGDRWMTKIMLHGMTDRSVEELASLVRSWAQPPKLVLEGEAGFHSLGYDQSERAYVLECLTPGEPEAVEFTLAASPASPIVNPAFIVKNWGRSGVQLKMDGKEVIEGKDFRVGHRHGLTGTDLVVWIRKEKTVTKMGTVTFFRSGKR